MQWKKPFVDHMQYDTTEVPAWVVTVGLEFICRDGRNVMALSLRIGFSLECRVSHSAEAAMSLAGHFGVETKAPIVRSEIVEWQCFSLRLRLPFVILGKHLLLTPMLMSAHAAKGSKGIG